MQSLGNNSLFGQHLLGIEDLSASQILSFIESSEQFVEIGKRDVKKVPSLRGKTIINLFLEPSTRTRTSFEIAAKRLSADAINISSSTSSVTKGETLIDTAKTIESMAPDVIVIRHSSSGAAHLIAQHIRNCSVINAGDGLHEHPTQALLDALTINQRLGRLNNLKVAIVGDAFRSRVARSSIYLHKALGNEVTLVGPPGLVPSEYQQMGAQVCHSLQEGIAGADVVVSLRVKSEYLDDFFIPDMEEYTRLYCLTEPLLNAHAPDAIVMAPGPFKRGVELTSEIIEGPRSTISAQVTNGVAVRMAVLFMLATRPSEREISDND